jgi:hypothetical protein
LNGDGTGDPIRIALNVGSLLAVSGADGSFLWEHPFELKMPGVIPADDRRLKGPIRPVQRPANLIGTPALADLNRDGVPDLVATVLFHELPLEAERRKPVSANSGMVFGGEPPFLVRRVLQVISGRDGRQLASSPIDPSFTNFVHPTWNWPATVVTGKRGTKVAFQDQTHWFAIDPASGPERQKSIDLGFVPVRPVQYADLDGDGEPELLAVGPGTGGNRQTLVAYTLDSGRLLWETGMTTSYQSPYDATPGWPVIADLDGDKRSEIMVPDAGSLPPADGYRGICAIDGVTGKTRWVRAMRPENKGTDGLTEIVLAPDLDHDGVRDLITSSFFLGRQLTSNHNGAPPVPERVYVDAISGKDGHPLWWWNRDNPTDRNVPILPLLWWGRGPDGWPLLAVPLAGPPLLMGNPGSGGTAIVINLEASSGREVSTALGLANASAADLNGDGLGDLWGQANGQLRAFRGEPPEAWRALGRYFPAQSRAGWGSRSSWWAADLDGDGVADAVNTPGAPSQSSIDAIAAHAMGPALDLGMAGTSARPSIPPGTRTVVARSGQNGRVLWKTELDPHQTWLERDHGDVYSLSAQPLPYGDLDADGTPELFVLRQIGQPGLGKSWPAATVPIQVLSGRTGRPHWHAGPLPLGFEAYGYSGIRWMRAAAVKPGEPPDLFVRHAGQFLSSPTGNATSGNQPMIPRLARISGRDGRIRWDVPLTEDQEAANQGQPDPVFADFDGDGTLELVMVNSIVPPTGILNREIKVLALDDGRLIWSDRAELTNNFMAYAQLATADLDGDQRPEVITTDQRPVGKAASFVVKALDGRDGSTRWTWTEGAHEDQKNQPYGWLAIARFDPSKLSVCMNYMSEKGQTRLVVLDEAGHERTSRPLPSTAFGLLRAADLDGDGLDELLVAEQEKIEAWSRDLNVLWKSLVNGQNGIEVIPGSDGRSGRVIVFPGLMLDGADGHTAWGRISPRNRNWDGSMIAYLEPGVERPPKFVSVGRVSTVGRSALPVTSTGALGSTEGAPVKPGLADADPRWMRPLPWTIAVAPDDARTALLGSTILAILNIVVPLVFLRIAAGRRVWTMRLMMLVPIAAAIPLSAYATLEPMIPSFRPPFPSNPKAVFFLGSLAGVPIVGYLAAVAAALAKWNWRALMRLALLTLGASAVVAAAWMRIDFQTKPSIDRYDWAGWYEALVLGAYLVGAIATVVWAAKSLFRPRPRPSASASAP